MFLLHPLFDHFGDALRLLAGQYLQVVDHHVHGRTGRGQIVVFEQRHHRHRADARAGRDRFGHAGAGQGRHR
ncbi:MAG TPA: hypothetical protein DCX52_06625, partial [Massilia sp.]|nr:hypothetical protein [Massilia sp.]